MDTIQPDVAAEKDSSIVEAAAPVVDTPAEDVDVYAPPTGPVSEMDQARLDIYKRSRGQVDEPVVEAAPVVEAPAAPAPDQLVSLKVNGQTLFRTQKDVEDAGGVAAIQKQISGDMKLAEAAEERKRLEADRAQLARERAELDKVKAVERTKQVDESIEAEAKALTEGILLGEEQKLNEAMKLVLKVAKQPAPVAPAPAINTEEIARQAAKQARYDLELETGLQEFNEKFADIATNEALRGQANQLTVALQQQYPSWGPRQVILEAARLTRATVTPPAPTALDEKNRLKAGAAAPIPHATARSSGAPPPQPKTPGQVFNQLAGWRSR